VSKGFLAVIVAVVLIFIGVFAFSSHKSGSNNKSSSSTSSSGKLTSHVEGKGQAGVLLVEYGDYQCPYCAQYFPIIEQVVSKYSDQIKFQFRNFPLVDHHRNAFAAARAAEAASQQNKFWQMYALLYQNQAQWSESSNANQLFQQYAKQLGLDIDQFNKDYSSSAVNDAINADKAAGDKLKIKGTPTFFLDGKEIQVKADVGSFESTIKAEIAKKQAQR